MPTSSQRSISLFPQPILVLNQNTVTKKTSHVVFDNLKDIGKKKTKRIPTLLIVLLILLALLALALIALAIALPLVLKQENVTTKVTTTTVATTTTTTNLVCISPYVKAPSDICVNPLLDFQNCGAIGNNCTDNYTSCSAAVCSTVPVVQLINSTSLWTGGINGSMDDLVLNLTLPFPITLYSTTTNNVRITTNGVLCLSSCSDAWQETSLPSNSFGAAVFPYWDDLYIEAKTWQGIYYAVQGTSPNRALVVEYYLSRYAFPFQFYHFQVTFFEATPGIVQFTYFQVDDTGLSATIGVQSNANTGPFLQYIYHQINSVTANMTLTFDTNLGIYTNSSIG